MKGRKLKKKILGIILAFFIAVVLSSIISTILHLILEPVIEAFSHKDIPKAVNYCYDIVESLVGEVGNREVIWVNGEKSVIKAGIMSVVLGNEKHKEYQNLPNTYHFISKMCAEQSDKTMLMDTYLDTLPDSHPAVSSFATTRIAPSKTRASFFTSALATLSIFIDKGTGFLSRKKTKTPSPCLPLDKSLLNHS